MRITGFTVIRNARLMGYPVVEAIRSILPVVDDYVVAVGAGDDDTRAQIEAIDDPKIRIVDTVWNTALARGGLILSEKTNEALALCSGDWCLYLQADEVVHERDLTAIREACERYHHDPRVEGLLFQYVHFYGSFNVVASARNWYRNEVRVVRNGIGARSVGDAQSFQVGDHKLRVMRSRATIYHYGWAKAPKRMGWKQKMYERWYHANDIPASMDKGWHFRQLYGLRRFAGAHPAVMQPVVDAQDWSFSPRWAPGDWNARDWKNLLSDAVETITGRRWGERKKYVLLRP